jgi:hypothetical protein
MNTPASPQLSDALRWALDAMHYPAMTSADWLARDIDPEQPTAAAFLTNPDLTLGQIKQAKSVFKTLRIVGETSAERRIGARMYAAPTTSRSSNRPSAPRPSITGGNSHVMMPLRSFIASSRTPPTT